MLATSAAGPPFFTDDASGCQLDKGMDYTPLTVPVGPYGYESGPYSVGLGCYEATNDFVVSIGCMDAGLPVTAALVIERVKPLGDAGSGVP